MTETIDRPKIEHLSLAALDVHAIERDWSKGFLEHWRYVECPHCPECDEPTRWIAGTDLPEFDNPADPEAYDRQHSETWEAWRCINTDCERFGQETEPDEAGAEGPMMNYSYELPCFELDENRAAERIAHLPLCIVLSDDPHHEEAGLPALALTGGGMDLTWEIAEAYMTLGYLPPLDYCHLPAMCGRGTLSYGGEYGGQSLSERDAWIIAGCRRSIAEGRERLTWRLRHLENNLGQL